MPENTSKFIAQAEMADGRSGVPGGAEIELSGAEVELSGAEQAGGPLAAPLPSSAGGIATRRNKPMPRSWADVDELD